MPNDTTNTVQTSQHCFVVMGFGIKTDFATGRKLDLDKSYRLLVKPVVESRGLVCVRADEILHSGSIDEVMYRELLLADVVIADLSTANPNALYELGIRHALRPRTTIVISESKLPYPFDLNHISITSYTHLGDAIDFEEVMLFRQKLGARLDAVLESQNADSPVYTYLRDLAPPSLQAKQLARASAALEEAGDTIAVALTPQSSASEPIGETLAMLIEQGEQAICDAEFAVAKGVFAAALKLGEHGGAQGGTVSQDPYLLRRLVLATYKAKLPDEVTALNEALAALAPLDPEDSNDPETVGLAAAIEKRLFEAHRGTEHLDRAINFRERGFYLRDDPHNGINLAYLLDMRVDTPLDRNDQERIADLVWANRIRRDVVTLCDRQLELLKQLHDRLVAVQGVPDDQQQARDRETCFWHWANKAEAHFGLGEQAAYEHALAQARALNPAEWKLASVLEQIQALSDLRNRYGHLVSGPCLQAA